MKVSAAFLVIILAVVATLSLTMSDQNDTAPAAKVETKAKTSTKTPATEISSDSDQAKPTTQPTTQPPELTVVEENLSPIDRIRAIQDKTALHNALLKDHDQFTRYPTTNRRFDSPEQDPTQKRYVVDERTTLNEDKTLALTAWTNAKYFLQDDSVRIFVTLQDDQQHPVSSKFAGHLIYNERDNLESYDFSDTNQDGIHELTIPVTSDKGSLNAGVYKLLIVNSLNDMIESVAFTVTEPKATLTGNYRDRINADGHLLIEIEIDVQEANRYYLEASLYSSTNDAIGQSNHADNLSQGKHWLPLRFYGLMIHDAGEPGPYVLKHLSLSRVVMPMQRLPLISPDYQTAAYTLDQLSTQRYAE